MLVVVITVAYGVEAVVVADMLAVAEIYYICHAFTCDPLYSLARETKCEMVCDGLWHYYVAHCGCGCRSGSLKSCLCGTSFWRSIRGCGFC